MLPFTTYVLCCSVASTYGIIDLTIINIYWIVLITYSFDASQSDEGPKSRSCTKSGIQFPSEDMEVSYQNLSCLCCESLIGVFQGLYIMFSVVVVVG